MCVDTAAAALLLVVLQSTEARNASVHMFNLAFETAPLDAGLGKLEGHTDVRT